MGVTLAALAMSGCGEQASPNTGNAPAAQAPAGDAPEGASGGSGGDPCKLLTQDEATESMGIEMDPVVESIDTVQYDTCYFPSKDLTQTLTVGVSDGTIPVAELGATTRKDAKTAAKALGVPEGEVEVVSGVGDAAFWMSGNINTLRFAAGDTHYMVSPFLLKGANAKQAAIKAAKLIVDG